MEDINLQIQEAELTPNRVNTKKSMPRHIIIKLLKTKDKEKKNLERGQKENNTFPIERTMILITGHCLSETTEARKK